MKRALCILSMFLMLSGMSLSALPGTGAVEERWWYLLEKGKRSHREGELGNALVLFEDAIRTRHDYYSRLYEQLIEALSLPELRRYGDDLAMVEAGLRERSLLDALRAVEETLRQVETERLGNSVKALLEQLKDLASYPEAEYQAGRVLAAEGEYALALKRFRSALGKGQLLQSDEERRLIQYAEAELYAAMGDHALEEATLLDILGADNQYTSFSDPFIRQSLLKNASHEKGLDHVLTLYRYPAPGFFEAHEQLYQLYIQSRRWDRARDHALFATLIASTTLLEELSWRNAEWQFAGLEDACARAQSDWALNDFLESSSLYKGLYWLGVSSWYSDQRDLARWAWHFLSSSVAAGEWRQRAIRQLSEPFEDW